MAVFVDTAKSKDGEVIRHMLFANESIAELDSAAKELGFATKKHKKGNLPNYLLSDKQKEKAVKNGATFVEHASKEWYTAWEAAKETVRR